MASASLQEKINRNVEVNSDGCWIWQGHIAKNGYGKSNMGSVSEGTYICTSAHRISYIAFKGVIPKDYHVDHLCRVKSCVNSDHLEAVTARENIHRSDPLWKQ